MHAGTLEIKRAEYAMTTDIHPLYYAWEHRLPIVVGLTTIITAAVKTSPVPSSTFGKWAYDFTHQLFNITNTRLISAPIPTPPEAAPIPKQ